MRETTEDRLRDEFRRALTEAESSVGLVEPTPDEARNGWTVEALSAYHAEQRAAQSLRIDPHGAARRVVPRRANSKYRPLRWRG